MKVLALDFDGVICNSAREVFEVGLRAYAAFYPDSRLAPKATGNTVADLHADAVYRAFCSLLPLGNRAEDFCVALRAIDLQEEIADQAAYDRFYRSLGPDWLEAFHVRFNQERAAFRDSDRDGWLRLHEPFTDFNKYLDDFSRRTRLAIVTGKDGPSVRVLLGQFGLLDLFHPELILDKDLGVHKSNHFKMLRSRTGVPFEEITFVDDKVNHLLGVAHFGIRLVLAGWGFNGDREYRLARDNDIAVASLADAKAVLFDQEIS
jgi:phosphoglycolate phosphatase-like HAD superfamily hydrolase